MNLTSLLLPWFTLPLASSETFNVTVCTPRGASVATLPLTVYEPGALSVLPFWLIVALLLAVSLSLNFTPVGSPDT